VEQNFKSRRNWLSAKLLVVDEVSMMSKGLFERLEFVARRIRRSDLPFGGIVLCFCGDFFQLPPVARSGGDDGLFCFESERWKECFASEGEECCFSLTDVFRQRDERLLRLLSEVRHNRISPWGIKTLRDLSRALESNGIRPTQLYPTNTAADAVNAQKLAELPAGDGYVAEFVAEDKSRSGPFAADSVESWTHLPWRLELRVGAQVMLLKNLSRTLVNGSRGIVLGFSRRRDDVVLPVVRFHSGETVLVERETDSKDGPQGLRCSRSQVPLRLCWAITIHKSQGMTIDFLEVDLGRVFEAGQAYVALSRARTLEGLRVLSFDPARFWTNPKVADFYTNRVRPIPGGAS